MAVLQRFLARLAGGRGLAEIVPATTGGAPYAGQIPALNAITGLLDVSMMPHGIAPDIDDTGICGATSLTSGMYVNIYNNGGTKTVRPADSSDGTKPAHGFVISGFSSGNAVTVYLSGKNNQIPLGTFTASDTGKPLYLSTNGGVATTRPTTAGNLDQFLGTISDVGSIVSSSFTQGMTILVA